MSVLRFNPTESPGTPGSKTNRSWVQVLRFLGGCFVMLKKAQHDAVLLSRLQLKSLLGASHFTARQHRR